MSTVYVVGAGASHGDTLIRGDQEVGTHRPPLTNGFFDGGLLDALGRTSAEQDLYEVIVYARKRRRLPDVFGEGAWKHLNLEELFK